MLETSWGWAMGALPIVCKISSAYLVLCIYLQNLPGLPNPQETASPSLNTYFTWLSGKESTCNAGDVSSIPWLGRFPGEGNGNPLQYSCLENPMARGAWQATIHGGAKESDTTEWLFLTSLTRMQKLNSKEAALSSQWAAELVPLVLYNTGTSIQHLMNIFAWLNYELGIIKSIKVCVSVTGVTHSCW